MSKENAQKFYDALKTDKALAEELQNALKAQKIGNDEETKQAVIAFAGSKGFAFTAAELAELETEARELSDDELDQVNAAGGFCFIVGKVKEGFCVFVGFNKKGVNRCTLLSWD